MEERINQAKDNNSSKRKKKNATEKQNKERPRIEEMRDTRQR